MALQVAQLDPTPDQMTAIRDIATEGYNTWKAGATVEHHTKATERMNRMHGNPEAGQQEIARITADFQAADADGDGRLNLAEYKVYMEKQMENARELGTYVEPAAGHWDREYALYNQIVGGEEGFTFGEYLALVGRTLAVVRELKAAEEASQ